MTENSMTAVVEYGPADLRLEPVDGWIPTEGVVTATLPPAQFEHGLKLMETGEKGSIKAILKP
jgi:hypothetical protein